MRRKGKIVAAVVGAVIVAIAAIPLFVNVNTFKPLIEEQLTNALGRKATVGKLSLSPFSGSVTADDLTIADDPQYSSQPFIAAKELRLGVRMRPLIFDHKIVVTNLAIEQPQIHLVHAASGAWNFSTIGQNAAKRTEQQKQQSIVPDFTMDDFKIEDGHAVVENLPASGAPMVYDKVNMTVDGFSFTKMSPFKVSANLPGEGAVEVTGKSGPVNLQDAAKTPFNAQVTLRHLDPVAAGFLEKSSGLSVLADVDAHAVSNSTTLTSNGTVHTQHLKLRPDAVPASKPIDLTYSVVHNLSDNTGQVQDAAFQTGRVTAHTNGTYSMKPGGAVTVNLKLAGQGIPIDDLQTLLPAAGVKLPHGSVLQGGTLTTNLNIVGPLNALVITGPVELSNTRLAGFNPSSQLKGIVAAATGDTGNVTNIQALRVQLQVAKNGITANDIFLSMPAIGDAVGDGTVSPSGTLNFKLKMKVDTSRGVGGKAVGLLSMVNGTAGKTAGQAAATGLPVTITGTSSNPIITPDVSGMMKANGKQLTNSLTGLFGIKKK
jgi:AsmA protein